VYGTRESHACQAGAGTNGQAAVRRPARRSSVGLMAQRALPRPHAGGCACSAPAPRQRGVVRAARTFTSARAWRALMDAPAAEPAPRPARRSSVGLMAQRAPPHPHAGGCACSAPAPRQRGVVRAARAFTSAGAWRALMHAHAAEPAPRQRGVVRAARAFTSARTPPVGRDRWQSAARPMRRCGC